jgi:hypothetical protein
LQKIKLSVKSGQVGDGSVVQAARLALIVGAQQSMYWTLGILRHLGKHFSLDSPPGQAGFEFFLLKHYLCPPQRQ